MVPLIPKRSPWIMMWSQPRLAMHLIGGANASLGTYFLAALFVLESFFFFANWWSLGLRFHYGLILAVSFVSAPLIAALWLYALGILYHFTGRIMGKKNAPYFLRLAIGWSKIPYVAAVFMWLVLIFLSPSSAFIQGGPGPFSTLFVYCILFIVFCWSFILSIQSIREIQQASLGWAVCNVLFTRSLSFVCFFLLFSIFRYVF